MDRGTQTDLSRGMLAGFGMGAADSYYRYVVRRERPGDWRVWLQSTLTGDLKDVVAMFDTASAARAYARRENMKRDTRGER